MTANPVLALADRKGLPRILDALGEGHVRFVGGVVRDALLGIAAQDIDLATTHSPYEAMRRLGAAQIKTIPTGIAHGTITAVSDGQVAEITTLRSDVDTDGRRATVAFTDDWRADAERRDFTVNALYFDPWRDEIFDLFEGQADLAAGRVRFIGDPLVRIAEDHLRILRFFRFYARFGRGEPDPSGLAACTARANDLMALSRERIADELLKLLALPAPGRALSIMLDHDILRAVLPEIEAGMVPRLDALVTAETASAFCGDPIRRLAALLPPDEDLSDRIAVRLKLSNRQRKRLTLAADHDLDDRPQALAFHIGVEPAQDRLLLAGRQAEARALEGWTVPKLPLGGGELIRRGLPPGPAVAGTLQAIQRRWVSEGFPSDVRLEAIVLSELSAAGVGV